MKIQKRNWMVCFFVCGMILLSSCQKEEREFIDPNTDNTIPRDSQLAKLMKNVVIHDGSFDDIIDQGNCFSINLPYSVVLNKEVFTITKLDDYASILVSDVVEIQFPIRITLADHTERAVANDAELKTFTKDCMANDDDIECIDFKYPILLSTFDSVTNQLKTLEVNHDAQMFEFMSNVKNTVSVSINYPIDLLLHNGQSIDAQHNSELLSAITEVSNACDENDN